MVTCQQINSFLTDYVDGELPAALRQAFDEHMAICPDCVAFLATYRAAIELSRAAEQQPPELPPVPGALAASIVRMLSRGPTS